MTETLEAVEFVTTPRVERHIKETFTLVQIAKLYGIKEHQVAEVVSRLGIFLISDPADRPRQSMPRQFHYFDVLALDLYFNFDKHFGASGRKTLLSEITHLLFGEFVSQAEARTRAREVLAEYDAAAAKNNVAKFATHMRKVHERRKAEIVADPFAASPLWWSRNTNQHFAIFGRSDHRLLLHLADKTDRFHGKISLDWLRRNKAETWVNATEHFCRIDAQLERLVYGREIEA
jgi:hypothetical protein